jgi:KaiC domain protein
MNKKYFRGEEIKHKKIELEPVPTGTKIDRMFWILKKGPDRKARKEPLGGIPKYSILNLVGIPDTGKSLFAQQFVIETAKKSPVLFVTTESPAEFVYSSLVDKCKTLGVSENLVDKSVVFIDAASNYSLRENTKSLLETMKDAIYSYKCRITIIDSITGLFESKEFAARQVVRAVYTLLKKMKQTALVISQKRGQQETSSFEAAGGFAVAHILDGSIVFDKILISSRWDEKYYGLPLGSLIRTVRIDGCRMCAHDTNTYVFKINDHGVIEIGSRIAEFIRRMKNENVNNE